MIYFRAHSTHVEFGANSTHHTVMVQMVGKLAHLTCHLSPVNCHLTQDVTKKMTKVDRGRTAHLKPLPQPTSYVLTRQHLRNKIIIHHQRDNLIFLMLSNRFLQPQHQSDQYIVPIPEIIDTAARVWILSNQISAHKHQCLPHSAKSFQNPSNAWNWRWA